MDPVPCYSARFMYFELFDKDLPESVRSVYVPNGQYHPFLDVFSYDVQDIIGLLSDTADPDSPEVPEESLISIVWEDPIQSAEDILFGGL